MLREIHIKGAKVHNLKNIELRIAHNQLVVITGLSGSGKSTLAFDTIFAEGQRRYVESLSAYIRQFLGKIEKPDVESITGIAPAIAIEQRVTMRNPRSTVGTSTEVYDYLRLLYARVGHTFSPETGAEVVAYSVDDVVGYIQKLPATKRVIISCGVNLGAGQGVIETLMELVKQGEERLFYKHQIIDINEVIAHSSNYDLSELYIVVDRIVAGENDSARIADSVSRALDLGGGVCTVFTEKKGGWGSETFSSKFELDGIEFIKPFDHLFSFSNPLGACPKCDGYGKVSGIDEELVIPDKSKSIYDDAIACWRGETMQWWKEQLIASAAELGVPIHKPFFELTNEQKIAIWSGGSGFLGLNAFFEYLTKERHKIQYSVMLARYTGKSVCPLCRGGRLRAQATYVKVGGKGIVDLVQMPIEELLAFFASLELDAHDAVVAQRVITEIVSRLQYLQDVGLGYLTLDRQSSTLSGGESQRINLATSLGSSLVGSLYILDEPSIGLHPRDNERLISVLRKLRDLGNTVIVVEHESAIIRAADTLIDMGPLAGEHGGQVVFNGKLSDLGSAVESSLTARYLLGLETISAPEKTRKSSSYIELVGARHNNLKNISVRFPLGVITCVTGVSGSGKSSLVGDILYPVLRRELLDTGSRPGNFSGLTGDIKKIKGVEFVDQNPIGRGVRSNPVTYIKTYDDIRKLFSEQPAAKAARFDPSSFSFNIVGGRCEQCKGEGYIKISMQFMADVELLCETCGGKRFKDAVLEVRYHGKSIYDVLEMSMDEAIAFFGAYPDKINAKIVEKLQVLSDVGLGYVKLGQSSATLSGGESQRVKLAYYLLKENSSGGMFFIFDEPTTGLHFHDIKKLLIAFNALIEKGHTIVIVEHNMDVIKCADHIIDLGPGAGDAGGSLVFEGSPADIVKCKDSLTGQFLKIENGRN